MAVRHHAYTFDPHAFLESLRRACTAGARFRPEALQAHARAIIDQADAASRELLTYLRYDDEWLLPEQAMPAPRWLVIALVPHLSPLTGLSHGEAHAYFVLDRILPVAGWPRADVDLLIRGESLDTLPRTLGDPVLAPWFQGLRQHGGWLNRASLRRLADALERDAQHFRHPGAREAAALADWSRQGERPLQEVTTAAFADAADMLHGARQRGHAIFVLFE